MPTPRVETTEIGSEKIDTLDAIAGRTANGTAIEVPLDVMPVAMMMTGAAAEVIGSLMMTAAAGEETGETTDSLVKRAAAQRRLPRKSGSQLPT
jgi:hypothetical protein